MYSKKVISNPVCFGGFVELYVKIGLGKIYQCF